MSNKANPALIGLFTVGGIALIVGGVILSSSFKLFRRTEKFVAYFDESLNGLSPGAPVKVRGVTVGSVLDIRIHQDQAAEDTAMPVILELDEDSLRARTDRTMDLKDSAARERLVARGFRAVLKAESLVTGILYVDLAVIPDAKPAHYHQVGGRLPEIPTARTDIQQLMENLSQLDVKSLIDRLTEILDKLDRGLGELQMKEINAGVTNLLTSLGRVVDAPSLTNSLAKLERTLDDFGRLAKKIEERVDPVAQSAEGAAKEASEALAEFRRGVQDLRDMLAPHGRFRVGMSVALDQLAEAARSLGELADYLERNPNSLISGRKPPPQSP